jgi:alanyl-tRNA synthetase
MVNADIASDLPVHFDYVPQEQALKINGLRAVFGEKYPPVVRVVAIGRSVQDLVANPADERWKDMSIEFCGGIHLSKTGDAEGFVIVSEEAVAKGVRRITALTGQAAHKASAEAQMLLARLEGLKATDPARLPSAIAEISSEVNANILPALAKAEIRQAISDLQKIVKDFERQKSRESAGAVVQEAREVADKATGNLVVHAFDEVDGNALREAMDVIRKKRPDAALLLGATCDDKVSFIACVPNAMIKQGLKAGDWVREVAKVAGGGGGGRPDMAQAGGKDPAKLNEALNTGKTFAQSKIGASG